MDEQDKSKVPAKNIRLGILGVAAVVILGILYIISPVPTVHGTMDGDTVEVTKNASFSFAFDRMMSHASVEKAFVITPRIDGAFSWNGNTVTFDPAFSLEKGKTFQVTIGKGASTLYLKGIAQAYTQSFYVRNDPEVSVVSPKDGVTVRPAQTITVLFDRPMRELTGSLEVPDMLTFSPEIEGEYHWLGTSGFEFVPAAGWAPATSYAVTLPKSIVLQDGSSLMEDFVWHFSTPNLSVSLGSSSEHVQPKEPVVLSFNYDVDPTVVASALTMYEQTVPGKNQTGSPSDLVVAPASQYSIVNSKDDKRLIEITRYGGYSLGKRYQFVLPVGFTAGLGPNGLTDAFSQTVTLDELGFRILSACPAVGGTKEIRSSVVFNVNNPGGVDTLEKSITISPSLEDMEISPWGYAPGCKYGDNEVSVDGQWQPSTTYTITVAASLKDIYGQALENPQTYTVTTEPYPPHADLSGYSNYGVLASDLPRVYQVRTINMTEPVTGTVCKVTLEDYLGNGTQCSSPLGAKTYDTTKSLNDYKVLNVDLNDIVGRDLENGLYHLVLNIPQAENYDYQRDVGRSIAISDTALTMKSDKAGTVLVWATDMKTGAVVSGLSVELYDAWYDRGPKILGTSTTDGNGLATFRTAVNPDRRSNFVAMATGSGHFGITLDEWRDGISPWNFGLDANYDLSLEKNIGYLYTDRRIYRPDQKVYFKGVLRKDVDAILSLPDVKNVDVVFTDPNGAEIATQTRPVSDYGTFNGELQLDPTMALGTFSFTVSIAGKAVSGSFDVREYRRPDFKVTVETPPEIVTSGDIVHLPIHAEYYYGAPLANARVDYSVTRRALYFQPIERDEWYSFNETDDSYCYWYCSVGDQFENVKSGSATLDANGAFDLSIAANLNDYKSSATYFVTATITDINQRQVSDNEQFDVHKGGYYVGIRPDSDSGWSSPTADFDLFSVTPDGTPLANATGTVTLYKRTWDRVQTEGTRGQIQWEYVKSDTFVSRVGFSTDAEAKAKVSFAPSEDGEYVAVAASSDSRGRSITSSVSRWVERGTGSSVRVSDDHLMKIIQNKADYEVGDTASLVVQSPYENAKALVTIERDTIRDTRVVDVSSSNRTIDIPITDDMTPNVFVSVLAVASGEGGIPEFRMGYADLQVNTAKKVLDVTVTPDKEFYRPGDTVTLDVSTKLSDGAGTPAEVSIAVVDERIVALLGSIDKNILGRFWFPRTIGVFTSQTLTQLVKKIFVETEGGGGKGGGGETTVRGNFQDTAFWKANVTTDGSGNATVSFPIADNLTTWQVLAIGTTKDTVVGTGEASIITRRDLMAEPILPRIVRTGDDLTFGATASNITDNTIFARVTLLADGTTINGSNTRTVTLAPHSRQPVSWNVHVPMDSKQVHVETRVEGGGFSDGFEMDLPVLPYSVPETLSTSNAFGREATETIVIPDGILPDQGEVTASVTTNVGTGLSGSFDYLAEFEYGCSEQSTSALVGGVLYEELVASKLISGNPDLLAKAKEKIEGSIQKLVSTQKPSGGWGFWADSDQEYPYLTAYVFWGLTQAEQAGYEVDRNAMDRADQYLRNYLTSPLSDVDMYRSLNQNERVQVLFSLSEHDPRNLAGYAATAYETRTELSLFGKSFLAMALQSIDGNASRANEVLNDVRSAVVYEDASMAYITEDTSYNDYFMNSDIRSTSLYLQALMRIAPKDDDADRIVRYLIGKKFGGYWYSTQSTAMVLGGLTDYVKRHPIDTDSLEVQVYLDDSLADTLTFEQGDLSGERSVTTPLGQLLESGNEHAFSFKKDSEKRYFYDLSYTVFRAIRDIQPFDNGMTVLANVYALDDVRHERPISEAVQGDTVRVHMKLLVPKEHRYVSWEYHLPSGLEPIDFSLLTSPQDIAGQTQNCAPDWSGEQICLSDWEMGWWWEHAWDHIEQRDDRVFLFSEDLDAGIYDYDFVASVVTPGTFSIPPTRAYEFYNPNANGHNEGQTFRVIAK
jgi:uncharacterized protein YfaS (alpha-2-macroglobulin family)